MKKQLLVITAIASFSLSSTAQTILGVDVSSYQGTPTWSSVRNTSTKLFAWAKATEGTTIADADFTYNETNGTTAKVVMGAYHFAHPETNTATAEANYFVSIAGSYIKAGNLPPALDLEDPPSGTALTSYFTSSALVAWVQAWMTAVQNATGVKPILYTTGSIANYLGTSLTSYPLWTADPDGSPTATPSGTYLGSWPTWTFKQYSWNVTVSGITSGGVDGDSYNGDTAQFNSFIGPTVPPVCKTFYTTVPYSTSFETQWIYDSCGQADQRLPDKFWKSSIGGTTPNDNDYWHRDDYTGGDWSTPASGAYTPAASNGTYSARFHNDPPPAGSTGALDLYINLSAAGTKTISFDYIHNEASPAPFKFDVVLSTDGGKTFTDTLMRISAQVSAWTAESVTTTATSSTGVIRFIVTDKGTNDVGIDNLSVSSTPTGIDEITTNTDMVVYPNPTDGTVLNGLFMADPAFNTMEVHIYDMMGRDVLTQQVEIERGRFSMALANAHLTPGTYMFVGLSGNERYMKTIVVK
jgi:GH25 family lysozyme M1 (1,4-beta-N-acetylmuramidase)